MSSSPNKPHNDRPRFGRAQNALLWLGVIVLALYPFPGWW
jgi:hypothetical protein